MTAMSHTNIKSLCSRCERFDIQAFGKSPYPYRGLSLSAVVQSAERGCSFCSLLVENLASRYLLNQTWLNRMVSPLYIQLQASKDRNVTDVEGGGLGIHGITASIERNVVAPFDGQSPQLGLHRLEINVSADLSKAISPPKSQAVCIYQQSRLQFDFGF